MSRCFAIFLFLFLALSSLVDVSSATAQMIDDTPTRVQTTLNSGMKIVGTLRPKSVDEISTSRWSIGCEVLDREYAFYDTYKDYLAPLGIRRIRIQGGWARTEKEKGLYDYAWLDRIVDDARSRGLTIWFQTSYGNPLYEGGGGRSLAGGIPTSEEALVAWDNWVRTTAKRYRDKIQDWEVWNEPPFGDRQAVYAFNVRTAEIIKNEIPNARIGGLVVMQSEYAYVVEFVDYLKEKGKLDLFQWVVYHHYTPNPDEIYPSVEKMIAEVAVRETKIELYQGESGVMSEWGAVGALNKTHWTELTQAKWDARRMLGDFSHDVYSSVFTICDFEYRTTPWINGLARYGLLKADVASKGFKLLKVKMAYYAVQNVISVFNDAVELDATQDVSVVCDKATTATRVRFRESGSPLVVFWDRSTVPSNENQTTPATITVPNAVFENPVWVDTITGNAYEIPVEKIRIENSATVFVDVPVYDAPTFIANCGELSLDSSEFVKANP